MTYVYSTLTGRKSFAGLLAKRLGIRASSGPLRGGKLICWGRSKNPIILGPYQWLNHPPDVVGIVSNKVSCFHKLSEAVIQTVGWTTDKEVAEEWFEGGYSVYERHILNGHSGAGIVLKHKRHEDGLDLAPLYTRQVQGKVLEYRVHVVLGDIICIQQKRKMTPEAIEEHGIELPAPRIRSRVRTYGNGWVFAVNDILPLSEDNQQLAIRAMEAVGAGSGCVDIAVTEDGIGYVIEINSAPALRSGTVMGAYAAKFAEVIRRGDARHG